MASADRIHLTAPTGGLLNLPGIDPTSAATASDLLTKNHHNHHIFFNRSGFHNHIAHHLLALYDLGALPSALQTAYDRGSSYQRPIDDSPREEAPLQDLTDKSQWSKYLGQMKYYVSWLEYFRNEIEKHGMEEVLVQTVFAGGEVGDDMLARLFGGFLHPFIHAGYALEFRQPAIMAEALAMATSHDNWLLPYLAAAEKKAKEASTTGEQKSLYQLLLDIRANEKLRTAPQWEDGNKIKGILERAPEEMISYGAQWSVPVDQLEKRMAESINAAALFTAASQRPDKQIKMDFYYMHSHNSSIFLPTFLSLPSLSDAMKVRLLEWKTRVDLALYASRRAPELYIDDIKNYVPKQKVVSNTWLNVIHRAIKNEGDDGHIVKYVRALIVGERIGAKWDGEWEIQGDMWKKIGQMMIDSVEEEGDTWARSVGFDEAWEKYGPRINYGNGTGTGTAAVGPKI